MDASKPKLAGSHFLNGGMHSFEHMTSTGFSKVCELAHASKYKSTIENSPFEPLPEPSMVSREKWVFFVRVQAISSIL